MRIATWNVERPKNGRSPRSQRLLAKIGEIKADIWVLTETHEAITPGVEYHSASTPTITTPPTLHREGEHMTTIWSRWPVMALFETATPNHATCVILDTPLGKLAVYGTVIPYHADRWPYGTPRNWDAHYAAIAVQAADWTRLRREHPDCGLCVAGDFNQNRIAPPHFYGSEWGRALLDLALEKNSLVGITQADFPTAEKLPMADQELLAQCIDHICLDASWAKWVTRVGIWSGKTAGGEHLSDHSGVFVDLV